MLPHNSKITLDKYSNRTVICNTFGIQLDCIWHSQLICNNSLIELITKYSNRTISQLNVLIYGMTVLLDFAV